MKLIVKIEREDVNTCKYGNNIAVQTQLIDVVFTPEALEELIEDYNTMRLSESPDQDSEAENGTGETKIFTSGQIKDITESAMKQRTRLA